MNTTRKKMKVAGLRYGAECFEECNYTVTVMEKQEKEVKEQSDWRRSS